MQGFLSSPFPPPESGNAVSSANRCVALIVALLWLLCGFLVSSRRPHVHVQCVLSGCPRLFGQYISSPLNCPVLLGISTAIMP